ncbi:MAG: Omp28-related outer membrane protein [Dysgonamonadaceae bacterium]|jgi:hypothetical protein|nr:Omp28-related outer membrane protein [Dysgonamonadaceae bacterium]
MKTVYFILFFCALLNYANAQSDKINADDNLFKFGYCNDEITTSVGTGIYQPLSAAINIPTSKAGAYANKPVVKIRIGLAANASNVSVWIRNSLVGSNYLSQSLGALEAGWTEITLATPFYIPRSDVYIGYTATGVDQIGFSGNTVREGSWLLNGSWLNLADKQEVEGSACIQVLIDNGGVDIIDGGVESIIPPLSETNREFTVKGVLKNNSAVTFTSAKLSLQVNNGTPVERTIETSIAPMSSQNFTVLADAVDASGVYKLTVALLELNGREDTYRTNNSKSVDLEVLPKLFVKRIVMEEGTGTWCSWCPRGAVGMAKMKALYPETFIGISIHNSDPMMVADYDLAMRQRFFSGYPQMVINRKIELSGDPYFDAENFYKKETENMSRIGVELNAGFTDETKTAIDAVTSITFAYSASDVDLQLAYVLTESGITGYPQSNAYANTGESMGGYENMPGTIDNFVHNDVARGIYPGFHGEKNSIPASVVELTPVKHSYTITLPSTIHNKDSLELAVILLDVATGRIINACKTEIGEGMSLRNKIERNISASISNGYLHVYPATDIQGMELYNLSGQKLISLSSVENPIPANMFPSGIYLVKIKTGADVKTVKVIKR